MKEVASDDELLSFGCLYQTADTSEIGGVIAFRDREAVCLEGGRFSEMNIREDECRVFGEKSGVLAEEFDFVALVSDEHNELSGGGFERSEHFLQASGGVFALVVGL